MWAAAAVGARGAEAKERRAKQNRARAGSTAKQVVAPYFTDLPSQFRLFLRRVATSLREGIRCPMPSAGPGSRSDRTELPPQLFPCGCPGGAGVPQTQNEVDACEAKTGVDQSSSALPDLAQFGPTEWRTCRVVRLR
eukprot:2029852-Amphidinium_carterae.2